ncbi:hypothetical protein V490_02381 [Pseudogymnoascus sp. VKM F-3557]|nr:hypothetical protein V490_02381 [Pseudogymnoascus sp. VKM F-3557]
MTVRRVAPPSADRRAEPAGGGGWDWDVLGKLEGFASRKAEQVRELRGGGGGGEKLPVMRIPAPVTSRRVARAADAADAAEEPDTTAPETPGVWPLPSPAPLPPDPTSPRRDTNYPPPSAAPSPVQRVREAVARNVSISDGTIRSAATTAGGRSATTGDRSSTTRSGGNGAPATSTAGLPVLRIPAPPLRGSE